MKKVLLVFISILTFSFLLVNNKTYAQELPREYPTYLVLFNYNTYSLEQENTNTYEYIVYYYIFNRFYDVDTIGINDYFLINDIGINFSKGLDRHTNSYEIELLERDGDTTYLELRVTVLKTLATEYSNHPSGIAWLFFNDTKLYVFYNTDTYSIDYMNGFFAGHEVGYESGYNTGYDFGYDDTYSIDYMNGFFAGHEVGYESGYNTGYDFGYDDGYDQGAEDAKPVAYQEGYNEGKQVGYEEGQKSTLTRFIDNFHVWIVPAIIIVFAIGVFVSYRRGRE